MREKNFEGDGDSKASDRWFKYGLIAYVVSEFIVIVFFICYELTRPNPIN